MKGGSSATEMMTWWLEMVVLCVRWSIVCERKLGREIGVKWREGGGKIGVTNV